MAAAHRINPLARATLEPLLAEDERLLWAEPVHVGAYLAAAAGAITLVIALGALGAGAILGGLYVLATIGTSEPVGVVLPAALAVIALAVLVAAVRNALVIARGAFSVYGVTNRRCLVASIGRPRLRVWLPLPRLLGVEVRAGGPVGRLSLTAAPASLADAHDGPPVTTALVLAGVKQADMVEALLLDLTSPMATGD